MSIDYKNDNTFIFTFVRMNPPTPGHLLVIEAMINQAINLNTNKIYIFLSNSMDEKNPLACSLDTVPPPKTKAMSSANLSTNILKSNLLKSLADSYKEKMIENELNEEIKIKIQNVEIIPICSSGNPMGFINSIIRRDYAEIKDLNMFFIVGKDRAEFVDRIIDNFKTRDFVKSINAKILPREGMSDLINKSSGDTNISDIPLEQYSASFIRKFVQNNNKVAFDEAYKPYLDQTTIDALYNTLLQNLSEYEMLNNKTKSKKQKIQEDEESESYYESNNLLPIIIKGGRKRKIKKITIKRKFKNFKKNTLKRRNSRKKTY